LLLITAFINYFFAPLKVLSIAISVSVCLSICLSARIYQKSHVQISNWALTVRNHYRGSCISWS